MHKPAIPPLLWAVLYPNPRANDPTTLQAHVSRHIVPEVQKETVRHYGHDGGLEAQYPGLDYTNARHKKRLSWFPHHRRLFRAFDELRLTVNEIKSLCRWEGTLYWKEQFEREVGRRVPDSAWPYGDPPPARTPTAYLTYRGTIRVVPNIPLASSEVLPMPSSPRLEDEQSALDEDDSRDDLIGGEPATDEESEDDDDMSNVSSEDDTLSHSVGVELNQRLLAATAARARGEEAVLDADWEQWLKEAAERDADATTLPVPMYRSDYTPPLRIGSNQAAWANEISETFRNSQSRMSTAELAALRAIMPPPPYSTPNPAMVPVHTAAEGAEPRVGTAM